MRGWFAVWSFVLAACRHGPAIPPMPSQGGPPWIELTSEHFTLWTDASAARGRALILDMERHRQVVLGVGFNDAEAGGRSFVVGLRDEDEVGAYLPEKFAAFAWSAGRPLLQPMIVLDATAPSDDSQLVAHELSHVISFGVIRNQPRWFAEGIAEFFASVEIDPKTGKGTIGKAPKVTMARLRERRPSPIAAMFACVDTKCIDEWYYPTAWAMFAYLANVHPAELLRYAARLGQVERDAMGAVWNEVFPALPPERFDTELKRWLYDGKHQIWNFETKLQQPTITERRIADGDVLAVRALLRFMIEQTDPRARTEVTAALAADPTNVIANIVVAELEGKITAEQADKVAAAHPEDWRAWWLVVQARQGSRESADAIGKVCSLAQQDAALVLPAQLCASMPR